VSESESEIRKNRRVREGLVFEKSSPGRRGYRIPASDVPPVDPGTVLGKKLVRSEIEDFPELAEMDVVRHYTRLSQWNYGVDTGLYPLGSCTMKYNPKVNENIARLEGFGRTHPLLPEGQVQGCLEVLYRLERCLSEITGMAAYSLQPLAGAHGELTGMMIIRAHHRAMGNPRETVLIPDSAHGTNPASAVFCGYKTVQVPSGPDGCLDIDSIRKSMNESVAALMLTNPNTLGIFEKRIKEAAEIVHAAGGLVYCDGANMNALMGYARPGRMGIDVMHLNLHKTFSTPHGGGGPGSGPVGVTGNLAQYLPAPLIVKDGDRYRFDENRPHSVGRMTAFHGNFGVMVRALAYILSMGPDGLKRASEVAVLNANYIREKLRPYYDLPYSAPTLHEVVFSSKNQEKHGVKNIDIAKRLMDYGFHPPTMSFPLIVHGALMIEPTETESRQELDRFVEAMRSIAEESEKSPDLVKGAPYTAPLRRLDEVQAARNPVLRWQKKDGQ
jgi:glycine dehydrogenase subunit 2